MACGLGHATERGGAGMALRAIARGRVRTIRDTKLAQCGSHWGRNRSRLEAGVATVRGDGARVDRVQIHSLPHVVGVMAGIATATDTTVDIAASRCWRPESGRYGGRSCYGQQCTGDRTGTGVASFAGRRVGYVRRSAHGRRGRYRNQVGDTKEVVCRQTIAMAGCATGCDTRVAELAARKLGGFHHGGKSCVAGLTGYRSIGHVLRYARRRLDHDATCVVFGRVSRIVTLRAVGRRRRSVRVDIRQGRHLREVGIACNQVDVGMAFVASCRCRIRNVIGRYRRHREARGASVAI